MKGKNEITFSGKTSMLREIKTKTGSTMTTFFLQVGKDRFKIVAFGSVAKAILFLKDGDFIECTGTGSINSWKDNEDRWHNDFQLSAWSVIIDEVETVHQKAKNIKPDQEAKQSERIPPPDIDELEKSLGCDAPF